MKTKLTESRQQSTFRQAILENRTRKCVSQSDHKRANFDGIETKEMKEKLAELEKQLDGYSSHSNLTREKLNLLPATLREIHSYRLFGDNLLAVPADLSNEGGGEDFERPFAFADSDEAWAAFESEYSEQIPDEFIPIGYLYGVTEIVLLNKITTGIHILHVQDIIDDKRLNYALKRQACTLARLIESLKVQTVCCFLNPNNYSQWDIFEMRENSGLKSGSTITNFSDNKTMLHEYFRLVEKSLEKGYKVHYAPKNVLHRIDQRNPN